MIVDWECSQYTKAVATMNARQKMEAYKEKHPEFYKQLKEHLEPLLVQLGL